jgi:hypothetical protein
MYLRFTFDCFLQKGHNRCFPLSLCDDPWLRRFGCSSSSLWSACPQPSSWLSAWAKETGSFPLDTWKPILQLFKNNYQQHSHTLFVIELNLMQLLAEWLRQQCFLIVHTVVPLKLAMKSHSSLYSTMNAKRTNEMKAQGQITAWPSRTRCTWSWNPSPSSPFKVGGGQDKDDLRKTIILHTLCSTNYKMHCSQRITDTTIVKKKDIRKIGDMLSSQSVI